MDVLLARDGDLLRLVFEELDVVVDVENVLVQLGKVVELQGEAEAGVYAAGPLESQLNEDKEPKTSPLF